MGKEPNKKPTLREDRLKAALKDNLRRRKAQARARKASEEAEGRTDGLDTDQGRS